MMPAAGPDATPRDDGRGGPSLVVDVVSDIVCPWCFIGKRKLEASLAELGRAEPALGVAIRWHPFQLNPGLPAEGIPRATYLAQKFGAARATDIYARVQAVGESVGIPFRFDRIERQPNTLDAHRLVAWAQQRGDASALVERLFAAYFIEGRFVGDRDELARLAAGCGWPDAEVRTMLASDAMRQVVADECRESGDVGIQGVPFFIFNGRTAVSGAHDPPMLLEAIAAARRDG
jgi:predicted DsbA family dithiol-disulfide isomerase